MNCFLNRQKVNLKSGKNIKVKKITPKIFGAKIDL
jgi:predicted DNA-binding antitoxin AbrB/MazE fold protein